VDTTKTKQGNGEVVEMVDMLVCQARKLKMQNLKTRILQQAAVQYLLADGDAYFIGDFVGALEDQEKNLAGDVAALTKEIQAEQDQAKQDQAEQDQAEQDQAEQESDTFLRAASHMEARVEKLLDCFTAQMQKKVLSSLLLKVLPKETEERKEQAKDEARDELINFVELSDLSVENQAELYGKILRETKKQVA